MNSDIKEGMVKEALKQLNDMDEEQIKDLIIKTVVDGANGGAAMVGKDDMDRIIKHIKGMSKDEILSTDDLEKFDFDDLMSRHEK
jgi:hypothetical protein